jgi:hypothetical protein
VLGVMNGPDESEEVRCEGVLTLPMLCSCPGLALHQGAVEALIQLAVLEDHSAQSGLAILHFENHPGMTLERLLPGVEFDEYVGQWRHIVNVWALCASTQVRRVGRNSSLRWVPVGLMRQVYAMVKREIYG